MYLYFVLQLLCNCALILMLHIYMFLGPQQEIILLEIAFVYIPTVGLWSSLLVWVLLRDASAICM
jgi:hypothetical protein